MESMCPCCASVEDKRSMLYISIVLCDDCKERIFSSNGSNESAPNKLSQFLFVRHYVKKIAQKIDDAVYLLGFPPTMEPNEDECELCGTKINGSVKIVLSTILSNCSNCSCHSDDKSGDFPDFSTIVRNLNKIQHNIVEIHNVIQRDIPSVGAGE